MTTRFYQLTVLFLLVSLVNSVAAQPKTVMGPLRRHSTNPRYFADPAGNAVFLTGSHTWANLQERGVAGETPDFDYDRYLDCLADPGKQYLVYRPGGGKKVFTVGFDPGNYQATWISTASGKTISAKRMIIGAKPHSVSAPQDGGVLLLCEAI